MSSSGRDQSFARDTTRTPPPEIEKRCKLRPVTENICPARKRNGSNIVGSRQGSPRIDKKKPPADRSIGRGD
jgi:hypothetical protein